MLGTVVGFFLCVFASLREFFRLPSTLWQRALANSAWEGISRKDAKTQRRKEARKNGVASVRASDTLLELATKKLKISRDDAFGLLLATCADCVAAVEILPADAVS